VGQSVPTSRCAAAGAAAERCAGVRLREDEPAEIWGSVGLYGVAAIDLILAMQGSRTRVELVDIPQRPEPVAVVEHEGVADDGIDHPVTCVELRHVRQQFGPFARSAMTATWAISLGSRYARLIELCPSRSATALMSTPGSNQRTAAQLHT
jgi:hypothetical protein